MVRSENNPREPTEAGRCWGLETSPGLASEGVLNLECEDFMADLKSAWPSGVPYVPRNKNCLRMCGKRRQGNRSEVRLVQVSFGCPFFQVYSRLPLYL